VVQPSVHLRRPAQARRSQPQRDTTASGSSPHFCHCHGDSRSHQLLREKKSMFQHFHGISLLGRLD
jgi:hypothetical protein